MLQQGLYNLPPLQKKIPGTPPPARVSCRAPTLPVDRSALVYCVQTWLALCSTVSRFLAVASARRNR